MPLGQHCARLCKRPCAIARDQHPREARMQRQLLHLSPHLRQRRCANGAQPLEQRQRGVYSTLERTFEPLDAPRIASPCDDVQYGRSKIDSVNLRLAMRSKAIAHVPQTNRDTWRRPRRSTRALLRGVGRNPLEFEAVDAALCIEPRDLMQTGIDDG